MNDFGKAVREILKGAGGSMKRQGKGSHEIWKTPLADAPFAVPVCIKSKHMANAILKQAGLPKAF